MGRLRQQERVIARNQARKNDHTTKKRIVLTPEEQQKLDAQDHTWFADLSPEEQENLQREREAMWSQIPTHLRAKADKLAGG